MSARILVIEDNETNLDLMVYLLRHYGYVPLTARDGEQGLEVLRREVPDLVICDLQMPKVDGFEVARQVRNDPCLAAIPLVAVTAYAMRGDRDKVLTAGFSGYLTKPIVPEEFVGHVESFLAPGQRTGGRPVVQASVSAASAPAPAPSRATILVVDDEPVNLALMTSILQPLGYHALTVASAEEALSVARKQAPDLIVSDTHMSKRDGYDLLKAVRADQQLSAIPFVLISSSVGRDGDAARALALGATKFLLRPIDTALLIDEIEACLVKQAG